MFCCKCGRELPEDAAFCGGCGTTAEGTSPAACTPEPTACAAEPTAKTGGLSRKLKIAILAGAVVAVVVLAVLLSGRNKLVGTWRHTSGDITEEYIFTRTGWMTLRYRIGDGEWQTRSGAKYKVEPEGKLRAWGPDGTVEICLYDERAKEHGWHGGPDIEGIRHGDVYWYIEGDTLWLAGRMYTKVR